jgi:rfaE bifunctional protein nucleotidyltransferase chain/domain
METTKRTRRVKILKIMDGGINKEDRIILDNEDLAWVVGVLKLEGLKVGYTSGVYDMFHVGHAKYLEKAKEFCDVLILAVDSDELVKKDKGPKRPIVGLEERIDILIRNRSVNIITVRNVKDDPFKLIKKIKPNILVFSKTTQSRRPTFIQDMKKAYKNYVDNIIVLPPQAETSTTARIRTLTMDASEELGKKIVTVVEEHFKDRKKKGGGK